MEQELSWILSSSLVQLKLISEAVERKANNKLKEYGVTLSQARIMSIVKQKEEHCSMKELEHYFHLSQQNMLGIVTRLEHKKLVKSYRDKEDRRVKKVMITERGAKLCQEFYDEMRKMNEWAVQALTTEEQQSLQQLLSKVRNQVIKDDK